jgi:putative tryptophan/tyrosine transport system substrate-binding protein
VRRRDFITLVGGAVAWPLAVCAQQSERIWRIGVMSNLPENDRGGRAQIDALRQGLAQLGWTDRKIQFDLRLDVAGPERAQAVAVEILAAQPDLIVCLGTPPTVAAAALT